jgi:hypothetical protein
VLNVKPSRIGRPHDLFEVYARGELSESPLPPRHAATGFRWAA